MGRVARRCHRRARTKRARYVMLSLLERARERQVGVPSLTTTDYINTIARSRNPGSRVTSTSSDGSGRTSGGTRRCWCTGRSGRRSAVGVHISTFASSASLYEVGFNHFFRGRTTRAAGTTIFYQGHASPACTGGRSWRAGSRRTSSTGSGRSCHTRAAGCRRTRTRG
ncbi:hypothetical protein TPA0907_63580 [Micromonospora humidisoli]|nr:hypothetical protein TPA0907_63580 [Micromonospora sp. AKA109]